MPRSDRSRFGRSGRGYQRRDRVGEQLREVVAAEIERRADDLLEKVTITAVDCSPDLRNATVYYTVLGDEKLSNKAASRLKEMTGALRKHVADTVRLRYTPALEFSYDSTIERGLRMEQLLREIGDQDDAADGGDEG